MLTKSTPHSHRPGARRFRLAAALALAAVLLLPAAALAAPPPVGGLTQLPGALGCVSSDGSSQDGAGTCHPGRGVEGAESVTVSPDGRFVYVGSYQAPNTSTEPGLSVFSRDPATHQLAQLPGVAGCLTGDGSSQAGPGTCTAATGIGAGDGHDFVITSDGRWAYATDSGVLAAIVLFSRDPATGVLTELPGTAGCITPDGAWQHVAGQCQALSTVASPDGISISPDDRYLYVTDASSGANRIHVLARNRSTGGLSEVQCLAEGTVIGCATIARDIGNNMALAISPDGRHAYSTNFGADGLSVFDRDPATGMLTQKAGQAGCLSNSGNDDTGAATCAVGRELTGAYAFAISPDGSTLYVDSSGSPGTPDSGGLAIFHIARAGTLTQLAGIAGCWSNSGNDNTGAPTCTAAHAVTYPYGAAISPDGRSLYVTEHSSSTQGGVAVFAIDPATGAASQLADAAGCLTTDGASAGPDRPCARGRALDHAYSAAVSPDGRSVYVAAYNATAVSAFTRETGPSCTGTSASTSYQTPVTVTLSCSDPDGDALTPAILTGPAHGTLGAIAQATGTLTYTPAAGFSGPDSFTFGATDGTNPSAALTATITVGAPPATSTPPPPVRPTITNVSQSHRRWREGRHGGTTFSFMLNEGAQVTFTFTQQGHRRALGRIMVTGHPGPNRLAFNGRINRRTQLKPGTYTVTITVGASTRRLTFTILR